MSDFLRATISSPVNISGNFTSREFIVALQHLKPDKAPGPDSIQSELILLVGAALNSWLCGFLSFCLHQLKISKIWKRALEVAITKPKKSEENLKSYRPISMLCVSYKILERLIHTRMEPIIDPSSLGSRLNFDTRDQLGQHCFAHAKYRGHFGS